MVHVDVFAKSVSSITYAYVSVYGDLIYDPFSTSFGIMTAL